MANRETGLRKFARAGRNFDHRGTSSRLRCGGRNGNDDDRLPPRNVMEGVMGNHDHGTASPLLRTGSRYEIRPMEFAALHLDSLTVPIKCSTPAVSRSTSRSIAVRAISAAYAAIASWRALRACWRNQTSIASRAIAVAGTFERSAAALRRSYVSSESGTWKFLILQLWPQNHGIELC